MHSIMNMPNEPWCRVSNHLDLLEIPGENIHHARWLLYHGKETKKKTSTLKDRIKHQQQNS